jgi:hypothetical protein
MQESITNGQARLENFLCHAAGAVDHDDLLLVVDPATRAAVSIPARFLLKLCAESDAKKLASRAAIVQPSQRLTVKRYNKTIKQSACLQLVNKV